MTKKTKLPLIGLLNEVLLPGETRAFNHHAVEAGTLRALSELKPELIVAVSITTKSELPLLIASRWATVAEVVSASDVELVLLGGSRARIKQALGAQSPYSAELFPATTPEEHELQELLREAHALVAALDQGARAAFDQSGAGLRQAMYGLLRATLSTDKLDQAANQPLRDVLAAQVKDLTVGRVVEAASCELEQRLRELADKPELSKEQRRALWSQIISLQRRLDVYDPGISDTDTEEITHLQRRLQQAGLPKAARVVAKRGLTMLRNMSTRDHDYPVRLGHLDFMCQLPWVSDPAPKLSISAVEEQLERDHYGLSAPKRRILEYLAVHALGGKSKGSVLCLAGPPGVGKTSLAVSISKALARPLVRIALGGVHEESEIRGHRLSYVAAAPGRILRGMADADTTAPILLLDELDKVGFGGGRSPASALLEVLDPEQNHAFRDNYLGVPYDLSGVLFICTANEIDKISGPLRDRLEIIELEGYTLPEKVAIAERHLITRSARDSGLAQTPSVEREILEHIIEGYTREAGVRELSRKLSGLYRARALALVKSQSSDAAATDDQAPPPVSLEEVEKQLGPPRHRHRIPPPTLPVGVALGLSVGAHGGSTLYIEAGRMAGKGQLRSTGKLGEVMKESVHAALAHLRIHPERYGIPAERLAGDFHIHLPEAAMAKEGPSAGVAVFSALLSTLLDKPLPGNVAMTGEITLMGEVLAVGGVRAKLLAAERAGLARVIVPEENRADVPGELTLEVIYVERVGQVVETLWEFTVSTQRGPSSEPLHRP